jgi:N-methylhydantoinase A
LEATVSDAATVLGYFNPDNFLGGRMHLDVDAAVAAVDRISDALGMGRYETAWGIVSLASDSMVKAVHEITMSQGLNPAESTIVAGGGAAGINILQIAKELGSKKVVLPRLASALSATGMHFADIVKEETRAFITSSNRFDRIGVNRNLDELDARLDSFLERTQLSNRNWSVEYFAEARYQAQVWDVDARLPFARFTTEDDIGVFVEEFHRAHEAIFAIRDESSPVEVINWKARLTVAITDGRTHSTAAAASERSGTPSIRPCYFGGSNPVETTIYRPEHLEVNDTIHGPAIIEEPTTTLVIFPGMSADITPSRNYILHTNGS